jgi:hypothetical protein
MKFAVWLRAFIDALMRTPYVRSLEKQVQWRQELHDDFEQRSVTNWMQQRQDLVERIRDKDAVINDLRSRLAVAEADVVREQIAKQPRKPIPVPEFSGPVSFQDELAQMNLEVDETQETEQ